MVTTAIRNTTLRFNGSTWLNIDIAESAILRVVQNELNIEKLSLSPLEMYILIALFDNDGMKASDLARVVGRAATSFTPVIDKLMVKGFIERRPDSSGDRRAINVHLTDQARDIEAKIRKILNNVDECIRASLKLPASDWEAYTRVLASLQTVKF